MKKKVSWAESFVVALLVSLLVIWPIEWLFFRAIELLFF